MRPSGVRSNTAPHASSSRTRSGACFACSSAIRQLFMYWPPRIVSAKCTRQLSRSSTFASAAATPPSAITVCALPRSDLQTRPTLAPALAASIAALSPAPPAPTTRTSCECVSYSATLEQSPVGPYPHGEHANVDVAERDHHEAAPRPPHMAAIEAAHAIVRFLADGRAGKAVEIAADEMTERVTAERVTPEQDYV